MLKAARSRTSAGDQGLPAFLPSVFLVGGARVFPPVALVMRLAEGMISTQEVYLKGLIGLKIV